MLVHTNTQVKNEGPLLEYTLKIWKDYPVDSFIFFNDCSTDNTVEIIKDILTDRAVLLNKEAGDYLEGSNRADMLEYSRKAKAELVFSIDADELFTQALVDKFEEVTPAMKEHRVMLPQYNVVGSLRQIRTDPLYANNAPRDFAFPMAYTHPFHETHLKGMKALKGRHKTPRTPPISKPPVSFNDSAIGFVHLQALNIKFYALKQLYYKINDYHENGTPLKEINSRYDHATNLLNFNYVPAPKNVIGNWSIDPACFDKIAEYRKYKEYINTHKVDELITFGEQYL